MIEPRKNALETEHEAVRALLEGQTADRFELLDAVTTAFDGVEASS